MMTAATVALKTRYVAARIAYAAACRTVSTLDALEDVDITPFQAARDSAFAVVESTWRAFVDADEDEATRVSAELDAD